MCRGTLIRMELKTVYRYVLSARVEYYFQTRPVWRCFGQIMDDACNVANYLFLKKVAEIHLCDIAGHIFASENAMFFLSSY
jgi:hypothetical protein